VAAALKRYVGWDSYTVGGHYYGFETGLTPCVHFYNNAILQKAGISAPFASYDDLVSAGRILKKKTGQSILLIPSASNETWMLMFQQQDGLLFDAKGNLTLDDPRALKTMEYLANGVKEGIFTTATAPYDPAGTAALKQGRAAGVLMPSWFGTYDLEVVDKQQSGQWRTAVLPAWTPGGRRTSKWGGSGLFICKQTKNVPLVWSLFQYTLMTKKGGLQHFKETGFVPVDTTLVHDPAVTDTADPYFGGQKVAALLASQVPHLPHQYQSPFWNPVITALFNEYTKCMLGKQTPAQTMTNAVTQAKAIIARGA
jgi:ABC-type glycerol-3-phosphate transport system substrate-binding protein